MDKIKEFIKSELKIRYSLVISVVCAFLIGIGLHGGTFSLWPLYMLREKTLNIVKTDPPLFESLNATNRQTLNHSWDLIRYNYLYENIEQTELLESAVHGIVAALPDNFSYLKNANDKRADDSEYGIIGVQLGTKDNYIYIKNVFKNQPAEKAGLQIADIIISVDDNYTIGKTVQEIKNLLSGQIGSPVKIKVLRETNDQLIEVQINRIKYEALDNVRIQEIDSGIFTLRIDEFTDKLFEEYKEAVNKVDRKNIAGLIIDLRDNTGGNLNEAKKVIETMINEDKLIVTRVDRFGNKTPYISDKSIYPELIEVPKVILLNSISASCSEIMTLALKAHQEVITIGETTYGKGVTTSDYQISDDLILNLVTANWFGPNDEDINKIGITPDHSFMDDPIKQAIELFIQKI
jgi:carboxyl-terminal processing protease